MIRINLLRPFKVLFTASIFIFASNVLLAQALPDFTGLVEENANAIVNVSILSSGRGSEEEQAMEELLREFYGDRLPPRPEGPLRTGLGSGFIISEDGYIVTNHHVVDGADEIIITLNDRREYVAELIGSDLSSDLALLKIQQENLPAVTLGRSSEVKVGEWVLAIGSPFGLSYSVSAGIISYMGRSLPFDSSGNYVSYIQTDVAINPGHSGGPLFNLKGEVIGINSQIFSNSGGSIGLSFAIPVDVAKNVIGQLREDGIVKRGWMGVAITDVSPELAEAFNLDTPSGALINQVMANSPAENAGFKSGDVIISFNDENIRASADLPYQVGLITPGSSAKVEIIRNGRAQFITMIVGDLAEARAALQDQEEDASINSLGIEVSELSEKLGEEFALKSGVVIDKVIGSVAIEAGFQEGDILILLNNQEITSLESFETIAEQLPLDQVIPVLISRGGNQSFFTLKLPE